MRTRFLRWLRNGLGHKGSPSATQVGELIYTLDTDLSRPFVVGQGNVLLLTGWCYHPRQTIRHLEVFVEQVCYRVINHSMARPEVLADQALLVDQTGHSLTSGFWVALPFAAVPTERQVDLRLRAGLTGGECCEVPLGTLTLVPSQRQAVPASRPPAQEAMAAQPLIAICMATYNPPLDLFVTQVESIMRQTYQNWLCIINDDSSAPAVFTEMQRIVAHDRRFQVQRNPSRLGYYHNFEQCLLKVPAAAAFVALSDQDDAWYADKLATLVAAFEPNTTLVYSDMHIVNREGDILFPTYWTTRRNNYTDLEALFFANTITGAASLFRATLLDEVLPFPHRIGDAYHDHWIACVALAKGMIKYVDRPLYAYRQHAGNVIGHYTSEVYRFIPGWSTIKRWSTSPATLWTEARSNLLFYRYIYLHYVLRLILGAHILHLRLPRPAARTSTILKRFAAVERGWLELVRQGIKFKLLHRPTLGLELLYLQGALGDAFFNTYHRLNKRRIMQRQRAASRLTAAAPGGEGHAAVAVDMSGPVDFMAQKIAPLQLRLTPDSPRRVNLLLSTIDFRYLFGGYMATFNLALQLSRHGYRVRLVIIDHCDFNPAAWKHQIVDYQGLQSLFDEVELAYVFHRSNALPVHPDDVFIANAWWAAHVAHRAAHDLGRERFIFLAQEYEPIFYPTGSLYALAEQAYTLPHVALFSTELLREYFRHRGLGVFSRGDAYGEHHSVAFQNAINAFHIDPQEVRQRRRRRLLFYARPESHAARNMFELGVLGVRQALSERLFDMQSWDFHGIGAVTNCKAVPLGQGADMLLLQRVSLQEYVDMLPSYDVGLSLMLSPHPSLVPLDMAAAGLVTVTNTYANKTQEKLAAISSNIIAVPPTVAGIASGLLQALDRVHDVSGRIAGSQVNWCTRWEDAFGGEVMCKLKGFIDG